MVVVLVLCYVHTFSHRYGLHVNQSLLFFSFMGMVLAVCLTMVVGATFFAYKNLYYAVMKKVYPDGDSNINSYEVTP